MKRIFFTLAVTSILWSCKTIAPSSSTALKQEVEVNINLNDVKDDKVLVTINAPKFSTEEITYSIPKMVPGTYSDDDYGRYIDDLKAFDSKGNLLIVKKYSVT